MPTISFFQLSPGMCLKEDLYNKSGLKLLPKGTIVTEHVLFYLQKWDIPKVEIEDATHGVVDERVLQNDKDLKNEKDLNIYISTTERVMSFIEGFKGCNKLKLDEVRIVVDEIMQYTSIYSTLNVINSLKSQDKYTYQHCINVSIYSMFIGKWLNLEKSALKRLIYAALLHDIGKEKVPREIIQKPGKLTDSEFNIIKKHPIYGYEIIKENTKFSSDIALGVLQHHEKEDGSGYPLGLRGNSIHLFAKIIAVADIFDAMTSIRIYKEKQSPFKTAEQLQENCFGELDPFIVTTFIRKLSDFYIGSTVILNNGEIGQVVMKIPTSPTRPLIKLNDKFIDLSQNSNLFIQDVLQ